MGRETHVKLIYGYRISLAEAFAKQWLNPSIMEGDDWQLLNDLDREEWTGAYVTWEPLRDYLLLDKWNAYILSSMQDECDPAVSFLFIYDNVVDVDTDVDTLALEVSPTQPHLPLFGIDYKAHLVIYNSY